MKITVEKNLAFSDQPKPLLAEEVEKRYEAAEAKERLKDVVMELDQILPYNDAMQFEVREERESPLSGPDSVHLVIRVENFNLGEHAYPPAIEAMGFEPLGDRSEKFGEALQSDANFPTHLAFNPVPTPLPVELETPPFFQADLFAVPRERGNQATTIFAPDDRVVFNNTSYPWSTCGRVDTPLGQASGVMVGPRHLLTCSHAIQWNSDGTAGYVQFRPSYYNGSEPFGEAWGTRVYFKRKVSGPTIDWQEGMYDYVCVVLNTRMGDTTGWMGARGYTDSWDDEPYWAHVGYPGDRTAGRRPTFENSISLDGAWWQNDSHESMGHLGDVWPGQSGGPYFGWWDGDVGPRAVAVQSSHNSSENYASGGQDMVDLIIRAKNDHP